MNTSKANHHFLILIGLALIGLALLDREAVSYAADYPKTFSSLVKKAGPSVVNILVTRVVKTGLPDQSPFGQDDPFRDFFDHYFGNRMPHEYRQGALGTGFIIDANGLILTNNHVVEDAADLKVKLVDEKEYTAEVVGRDPKTDVALIRIKADERLSPLPLGDSDTAEVGDWVVAIGNPFGLGNTVTSGIISAKYRQIGAGAYDNFIQTDASINPGNSGGPLLSMDGKVIGINSAIFSQSGGSVGIGFAIPINMVKDLLPQLRQGKVRRAYLGVMIQDITPELEKKLRLETGNGALVSDLVPDGPAAKAGILRGDVITAVDGKDVKSSRELPIMIAAKAIGKPVKLEVLRKGKKVVLAVVPKEMEDEAAADQPQEDVGANLGMSIQTLTPDIAQAYGLARSQGVLVMQVVPGASAAEAGLQPGDVIIEADQQTVADVQAFKRLVSKEKESGSLLLLVERGGSTVFLTMALPK